MITPAHRISNIEEYYFSRRLREVSELRKNGQDIISLGIGGPDRPPHNSVVRTLCESASLAGSHSYQMTAGLPELREAYATWYKKYYGVELNPTTEILPLIGSKEGVLYTDLTFLNPGDAVLVPNPGYPTYTSAAKIVGAEIIPYELTEERGWLPDFDALEKLPLDHVKLMWVNYPHMPTGTKATYELFEKLVDFGKKHDIVIAHDNPYSFILDHSSPLSILSVPGARDVAIELNSLSKSHNMAGWRVAMLASNERFVKWIFRVKSNVDSGQFKPVMLGAIRALGLGEEWFTDLNREYNERRVIAEKIMDALGCTYDPDQTGMFLWGRIPDCEKSGESMADRLLYDKGIFVAPGFIFGSVGNRYIRISLCATKEALNKALNRL